RYSGHLPQPDQWLRGTGGLFPEVDVASYGTALRLEVGTGTPQASFLSGTPAIISNSYGQGRALIWGFDLVEVLQRDAVLPASAALFDLALLHVAPTTLATDHAPGSLIPLTTEVENRADAVDLQLQSTVDPPLEVIDAAPTPTQTDTQSATWAFSLGVGEQRSFDLSVQSSAATLLGEARSVLSQRDGPLLRPLGNISLPLLIRDPDVAATELIDALRAASLRGGESAARDRAINQLESARQALSQGDAATAISATIGAADEVVRIQSVPHAAWRLGISRLLEVAQRASCAQPDSTDVCSALGVASQFNGFFLGDYLAANSDVQGALAAGGRVELNNYSIGDQLMPDFDGPSLLAGGDIVFPSGRVYQGDIVAGGSVAGVGSAVINGLGPNQTLTGNAVLPFDFAAEGSRLQSASQALAELPANGSWTLQWGGLYLRGDGQSARQIFDLPADLVWQAHTFEVKDIPAGAEVLFNIRGAQAGLTNMSLQTLVPHRERVLFNFPEATQLTLQGISVEGAILAPLASVEQPQGVVWGHVVAAKWNGMMQINMVQRADCQRGSTR
ncbi:MAG: choice-of-anchor A family protein, partial [Xanthomonadales bacterium]|nr:choice-of-anchor A family protein [Xanthomonadales bacterium]